MKIIQCEQRSPEWFAARLGIPTASAFGKIITRTGNDRKGATTNGYLLALLGERLTRTPAKAFATAAMDRGSELEPFARAWYAEHTGRLVQEVGFILHDSERFGCSPDGLTDWDCGLEIKCPMLPAFLDYATTGDIPDDYWVQMQGSMYITGLKAWDYLVFTDVRGLAPILTTVHEDITFQAALSVALLNFGQRLDALEATMRDAGNGVPADTPIDLSALNDDVPDLDGLDIQDFNTTQGG